MSFMSDIMKDDAAAICDPDGFAESLTYYPYGAASVPVDAIVLRDAPKDMTLDHQGLRLKQTIVYVPQKTIATVNCPVDQIGVPEFEGGASVKRSVVEILGRCGGMWKLRLG
jgi:hypothetical protein